LNDRLKRAVKILEEKQTSCVILSSDGCEKTSDAMGIKPLMMELRVNQSAFQGCVIADKVIGKAAALMTVLGKADAVYGKIMSENAREFLEKAGMDYAYGEMVPYIENRTRTGKCPMEETVLYIDSPEKAFEALEKTIANLMAQKQRDDGR